VGLLERAAVVDAAVDKLLDDLVAAPHVAEVMLLATCNRVEVYAEVDKFHGGVADVSGLLAQHVGMGLEQLSAHLYVHYEERAAQHLFAVACGMDSMLVGESQILGQVRSAFRLAQERGTAGRMLHEVVQHALRTGKRARAETDIGQAGASLVSVGLGIAEETLDGLVGRRALVVGAGSMSAVAVAALQRAGLGDVAIANRTPEKAQLLAERFGGRAVPLSQVPAELHVADVVVSCTGATGYVISESVVTQAVGARGKSPLFLLDLALPRDIEPAAAHASGVTLLDLERLGALLGDGEQSQAVADDVAEVGRIIDEEVLAYTEARRAAGVAPTVVALRSKAQQVVATELKRLDRRLPELDDRAREEVATAVRRVVEKLLHAPTVRVQQLSQTMGPGSYAEALRELFELGPAAAQAAQAVSQPDTTLVEGVLDPRGAEPEETS
jgi:glutamyl-tRNA reductase